MNNAVKSRLERRHIGRRQLTLEHRILNVVAEPAAGLENPAQAFVVGDVVADEVGGANSGPPG